MNSVLASIKSVTLVGSSIEGEPRRSYHYINDGKKAGLDESSTLAENQNIGYVNLGNTLSTYTLYSDAIDIENGILYAEPELGTLYLYVGSTVTGISTGDRSDMHPARLDVEGELVNYDVWKPKGTMYEYKNRGLYSGVDLNVSEKLADVNANLGSEPQHLNIQYDIEDQGYGLTLVGIKCDWVKIYTEEYRVNEANEGMWFQLNSELLDGAEYASLTVLNEIPESGFQRRIFVRIGNDSTVSGSTSTAELLEKSPYIEEAAMFAISDGSIFDSSMAVISHSFDTEIKFEKIDGLTEDVDNNRVEKLKGTVTVDMDKLKRVVRQLTTMAQTECAICTGELGAMGQASLIGTYTYEPPYLDYDGLYKIAITFTSVRYQPAKYSVDATSGYNL